MRENEGTWQEQTRYNEQKYDAKSDNTAATNRSSTRQMDRRTREHESSTDTGTTTQSHGGAYVTRVGTNHKETGQGGTITRERARRDRRFVPSRLNAARSSV